MSPRDAQVVFLDLDGTIVDSWPGIIRCLRHALPTVDLEHITDEDIRAFLGPPLKHTLIGVHGKTEEDVERFVVEYRSVYFGGGEYEFDVFPGMAELVGDLHASDRPLVLATAKPIESATRVLTKAGLLDRFDAISGSELDLARQGKAAVLAHGLELIQAPPTTTAVMIGDRKEDILGAKEHGFTSIGVSWGYADPGELQEAGADHVVDSADALRSLLGL